MNRNWQVVGAAGRFSGMLCTFGTWLAFAVLPTSGCQERIQGTYYFRTEDAKCSGVSIRKDGVVEPFSSCALGSRVEATSAGLAWTCIGVGDAETRVFDVSRVGENLELKHPQHDVTLFRTLAECERSISDEDRRAIRAARDRAQQEAIQKEFDERLQAAKYLRAKTLQNATECCQCLKDVGYLETYGTRCLLSGTVEECGRKLAAGNQSMLWSPCATMHCPKICSDVVK